MRVLLMLGVDLDVVQDVVVGVVVGVVLVGVGFDNVVEVDLLFQCPKIRLFCSKSFR